MKKCSGKPLPTKSGKPSRGVRVYRAALAYRNAGLSFYPVAADGTKQPAFELLPRVPRGPNGELKRSWGVFRERQPSVREIRRWFRDRFSEREYGMAIICGAASGGLEAIDIDDSDFVKPWSELVEEKCPGLLGRLVHVKTPRPGQHIYYRCAVIGGSTKLAQIASHQLGQEDWRPKTIIELKAEGACCLAPPSPPACHPACRPYRVIGELDLTMIPTISEQERQVLLDAARHFDTWLSHQKNTQRRQWSSHNPGRRVAVLPGDDFNIRAVWAEILDPHGWRHVGDDGLQTGYWCRPGKASGTSASTNYEGSDLLYVFSSSAHPFEPETAYTKFHAFALLEHHGDFSAAARDLAAKGYGSRRSQRRGRKLGRPFGSRAGWAKGGRNFGQRRKPR